jgi:hypothetical protein
MSLNRYAARRDANDAELLDCARKLGWWMIFVGFPVDYVSCFRNVLHFVELKTPKGRYTPAQEMFLKEANHHGITVLTWREISDVLRDSNVLTAIKDR